MTTNKINRTPDDPMWSGRYVQGADGGWDYSECTFEHLESHLVAALRQSIQMYLDERPYPSLDGHGVVAESCMEQLASLFELVDNLQRYLPWIRANCVGWWVRDCKDGTPDHFEIKTAHRSYIHA